MSHSRPTFLVHTGLALMAVIAGALGYVQFAPSALEPNSFAGASASSEPEQGLMNHKSERQTAQIISDDREHLASITQANGSVRRHGLKQSHRPNAEDRPTMPEQGGARIASNLLTTGSQLDSPDVILSERRSTQEAVSLTAVTQRAMGNTVQPALLIPANAQQSSQAASDDFVKVELTKDNKESANPGTAIRTEDPPAEGIAQKAIDTMVRTLVSRSDPYLKHDLLTQGQELAAKEGISLRPLLSAALQPRQPTDIQLRALAIAAETDLELVQNVATNDRHPLQENAAALLSSPDVNFR